MVTVVHQIGNTKITAHSPSGVIGMEPEQQQEWMARERDAGNILVERIVAVVEDIYLVRTEEDNV